MLKDLVYSCRSYRRFYEEKEISMNDLKDLVDLARITASTAQYQARDRKKESARQLIF